MLLSVGCASMPVKKAERNCDEQERIAQESYYDLIEFNKQTIYDEVYYFLPEAEMRKLNHLITSHFRLIECIKGEKIYEKKERADTISFY